jgi:arsenate reductase-like glutaredoxin family protein
MNIQIIGTRKSSATRKAERYFKERGITYQFVDVRQRSLSPGELQNIAKAIPPEELIDPESKAYKQKGLAYMEFDILEEILENPLLLKLPVVRSGNKATVGYAPEVWETWIKQ